MEAIRSSERLILTRPTRRQTPEDGILHTDPVKTSSVTMYAFSGDSHSFFYRYELQCIVGMEGFGREDAA
jgi:hypothetical protein